MLWISSTIIIPDQELEFHYVTAQGPGGQHVNRSATAVQLRFNFMASTVLPEFYKTRLMATGDRRVSRDGFIVIRAQRFRSQERNREDALMRLSELLHAVTVVAKKRRPTAPTRASRVRRLEGKVKSGERKKLRKKVNGSEF